MQSPLAFGIALTFVACKPTETDTNVPDTDVDTDVVTTLPVWLATGGGPPDSEEAMAVADVGDGTVVAVGWTEGFGEFVGPDGVVVNLQPPANQGGDMFVARFDAVTGSALSAFSIGGEGFDVGWDVSGTGDGGFYAIGHYTDDVTVGPSDDPVVLPVVGEMSAVLGSWDADNHRRFALAIGDVAGEFQMRVDATSDGGALFSALGTEGSVVAPGTDDETFPANAGEVDILLGKVDATGAVEWVRTYGGEGSDWFGNPIETEDGYLLSGQFTGTANFGGIERTTTSEWGDGFVARFLWDGTGVWVTTFASPGCDVRRSALTDDGGVVVAGAFGEDVTFDSGGPNETTFTEFGLNDAFLARLNADDGSFEWAHHLGTPETDQADSIVALPGGGVAAVGMANWTFTPADLHRDWSDEVVAVSFAGWVARFDAIGEPLTFDTFHGASIRDGALLPDGDLLVGGAFATGAVFGRGTANELAPASHSGGLDPYLLRLDY